jgi:nucleoside-diphosphate-sugar epimerase
VTGGSGFLGSWCVIDLLRRAKRCAGERCGVLRASFEAGIERMVMTSSIAAITGGPKPGSQSLTEDDWSDPDSPGLTPYARPKRLVERAAWDFARERGETEKLTVVNPAPSSAGP